MLAKTTAALFLAVTLASAGCGSSDSGKEQPKTPAQPGAQAPTEEKQQWSDMPGDPNRVRAIKKARETVKKIEGEHNKALDDAAEESSGE